ncbi:MAG: hypothetical protein K0S34_1919 [Bacillales bacterium]|nr:hypothetical protein [Bacillales bacterium]
MLVILTSCSTAPYQNITVQEAQNMIQKDGIIIVTFWPKKGLNKFIT